jgi:hypothetical protein
MTIVMFDSIDLTQFPANPEAVAGYVGGHWPTYNELVQKFPNAHHLSIAVNAGQHARCLDVEPGDATNDQAAGWLDNYADRSQGPAVLYTSASNVHALRAAVGDRAYLMWSAHYTMREHICGGGCGYPAADATQWTDKANGRNLDQSCCADYFFGAAPDPTPPPPEGTMAIAIHVNENGHSEVVVHLETGEVKNLYKVTEGPGAPGWKKRSNGEFDWETLGKPGK